MASHGQSVMDLARKVRSGTNLNDQTKSVDSLAQLLNPLNTFTNLSDLGDKSYHEIFEAIFAFVLKQKTNYYDKKKSQAASATRLSKCAVAVRMAASRGASKIGRKTLLAAIDHITQTLHSPDNDFIRPLFHDYVKALAELLSRPANAELLARKSAETWRGCVDLFLDVALSILPDEANTGSLSHVARPSPAPTASSSRSLPRSSSSTQAQRLNAPGEGGPLKDVFEGLFHLVSAVNAPILLRMQDITDLALRVLSIKHLSLGSAQTLCFSIINTVFCAIEADNLHDAITLAKNVLPHMGYWWRPEKSSQDEYIKGLRNEISRGIILMHLHFEHMAINLGNEVVHDELEDLVDSLWQEYSKRGEAFRLQLSDLTFGPSASEGPVTQLGLLRLRPHNVEGESHWAVVQNLAYLEAILLRSKKEVAEQDVDNGEQPRKRRRIQQDPSPIRVKLKSEDAGVVRTALQLVPFMLVTNTLSHSEVDELLGALAQFAGSKNTITASWALIACASCALWSKECRLQQATWTQIWHSAARSISLPAASRAACLLIHSVIETDILPYHHLANDINNMITTADINGPGAICDTSLALMSHLYHLRNSRLPSASQSTSSYIIRWMFLRWNPSELAYSSFQSAHVRPIDVANLLYLCCGAQSVSTIRQDVTSGGLLGEAWISQRDIGEFNEYLLLLGHETADIISSECCYLSAKEALPLTADASIFFTLKRLILELLYPKLEDLRELCNSWGKRASDGGSPISANRFQSLMSACIVGTLLLPHFNDLNSTQSASVEALLLDLAERALLAALSSLESTTFIGLTLRELRPCIPEINTACLSQLFRKNPGILNLLSMISGIIEQRQSNQRSEDRADFMDVDDDFDSSNSQAMSSSNTYSVPRHNAQLSLNPQAFYIDTRLRLVLLRLIHQDKSQLGLLPNSFFDNLLARPDDEILSCQRLLIEIIRSDLVVTTEASLAIVERLGKIVGNPEFQSSEVAQITCIEVIDGLSNVWLQDGQNLADMVGDLYIHFVKVCFPSNILSPKTQMSLARLLFTLLRIDPEFGKRLKLDSCRTSLLLIMKESPMKVKCFIAERIAAIFELYILSLHEDVFVDILNNLPNDDANMAGIAFRQFVLSKIACSWPTLLRRCVYHIFETPGKIPRSADYTKRCLADISIVLNLKSPTDLFQLFSSQLLYTWLDENTVASIPYSIFGFTSLRELLKSAQAEAIALATMRGQDAAIAEIARLVGIPEAQLIQQNFATSLAYALLQTLTDQASAAKPKEGEKAKPEEKIRGEDRIKGWLGSKVFIDSAYTHFIDIVALFFDLIDQEDSIEKVFSRQAYLKHAGENMAAIKAIAHSSTTLPPNQQPMFKAKFVFNELVRLCQSTEFQFHDLWTPAVVAAIARKLFNTVHPALGPLHACSVLRKVRILVCLAGSAAWDSYCLEMLLTSIRGFIVDPECADDALGISQYLLSRGKLYLTQVPSFLAGYSLSALASLRVFLESSQSSTTQESQFKATMSKAQKFHEWFSQYLAEYTSPRFESQPQNDLFKSITMSAARIRSSGNAEKNTSESKLLLDILNDEIAGSQLLNESSRQLALGLLCGDFMIPTHIKNDVLESDQNAINHASAVWKSCGAQNLSENYLAWAGRVVGRSFLASGSIPNDILRESRLDQYEKIAPGPHGSEMGLLHLLQDLTTNPDSITAGLAEATLRTAISRAVVEDDGPLVTAGQRSLSESLFLASQWGSYRIPPSENTPVDGGQFSWTEDIASKSWLPRLSEYLAHSVPSSILLSVLSSGLLNVKGFAEKSFPFIVHLVLYFQLEQQQAIKKSLSNSMKKWLGSTDQTAKENIKLLINTILYLRTQEYPKESSIVDRLHWLDIDYALAASSATRCGMHKTALLFSEIAASETSRASRRTYVAKEADVDETLLAIFENIDDPDAYYGLAGEASLSSVLSRLEYEQAGTKNLAFRGAQYDSHIRLRQNTSESDAHALVKTLGTLGLAGLSHSLMQTQQNLGSTAASIETTFQTARRLEIWNLPVPAASDHHAVVTYKAYQIMQQATSLAVVRTAIYDGFARTMKSLVGHSRNATALRNRLGALAALSELDETLNISDLAELEGHMNQFQGRSQWMKSGLYDDVSQILSCRGTTMSLFSQRALSLGYATFPTAAIRQTEVKSMLLASSIYRYHQATQESLNISAALNDLIKPCEALGVHVDVAVAIEVANSLWDHGEMSSSIKMLQGADNLAALKKQAIPVSRSDLLSKIGHRMSVARLENPRDIQKKYLEPALKDLRGSIEAKGAGLVFHQFAVFCDEQLQDQDSLEDLKRLQSLKKGKNDEVEDLKLLISSTKDSQLRAKYTHVLSKEKQWLDLDEQELRRVETTRNEFVRLSLENYLLSLASSDEHNNDALRFTALWFERSDDDTTSRAVGGHLAKVPTAKFAGLMSQLTSRLQSQDSTFQELLADLVYNICVDHPYHGMYHIWSSTKARVQQKDEVAILRVKANEKIAQRLAATNTVAEVWVSIEKTSKYYHGLALDRDPAKYKSGAKVALKDSTAAKNLVTGLTKFRIPPPTMHIEVNTNKDYSRVPMISRLEPTMTIASGVSAPKIITAIGTDGMKYKQLVKGGQDDLRQDAIMEQVFAAVSSLLKLHRATRQRNLGIRTYKVLPLTASSGLIEFVRDTIPLHEFLMPAHERYNPRDLKGTQCRKEIFNVQNRTVEQRISTYRKVTDRFQPVMRYFFMEYFVDPDEWFARRLAYTRSTAAISMLGHVLGLGDRHGHNILLDTKTGEAVHIDLGIAFETGRILPVPELVPFRLTRDIVDGMGIAKTEGVFRRCCEFTLDALREEQYSIMTILDVLRYDPLYSWSVSPVRLAKLQKARQDGDGAIDDAVQADVDPKKGKTPTGRLNEPSEGDRALEVVRKKLSKTLSVTAMVNDLINQATDERNLAVLYSGWAAYAHFSNLNPKPASPLPLPIIRYPPALITHPAAGEDLDPALSLDIVPSSLRATKLGPFHRAIDRPPHSGSFSRVFDCSAAFMQPATADAPSSSRRRPRVSSSTSPTSSPSAAKRARFSDNSLSMASVSTRVKMPDIVDLTKRQSAYQPLSGARKLVIKNVRSPARSEARIKEYYARTERELEGALDAIFNSQTPAIPLERLYRGVEDLCRKGNADTVYRTLKDKVDGHLKNVVLPKIQSAARISSLDVLRKTLAEWKTWNAQTILVRSTFSYLDRTYLLLKSLPSINDMAITRFCRMAFSSQNAESSPNIGAFLISAICELVNFDRRGDNRKDSELLKDSIMMLYVLGVYTRHFEPVYLQQSEAYFREFGETCSPLGLKEYIEACERLLGREDYRCMAYNLDSTTERQSMSLAHSILIDKYSDKLLHGGSLSKLLTDRDVRSLKGLYDLLRLSGIQKKLKTPWSDYIRETGASIVSDKNRGDEMVIRLLDLRRALDLTIRDAFSKDEDFLWGMRESFGKFMNDRKIADCWSSGTSKIGEMTAKHIDMLLRGGIRALPKELLSDVKDRAAAEKAGHASSADEDAELDRQLDQALELFRFIEGKDAFEAFYKKDLARRLLMGRSASQDAERNMLTKLRGECGSNFTHNLEQMFKDQELAKDEMEAYKEWCDGNPDRNGKVDLQVMILSAAAWPTYPDVRLNLPDEVAKRTEQFERHYKNKHTGRVLTWKHSLAHCSVKATFPKGAKELLVSAFQAAVLLLFNDVTADGFLAYEQISAATGLQGGDLDRTLQSLACGKARVLTKHPKGRDVNPTDTFTFNKAFTDPKYRVKINQIQLKETKEENKATHEKITQDRRFETQAAIVRIMKSRKTMGHAELVAEVINLTKKRGSVEPAAIKKEIESLIEKDYIEREENSYTYLA